MPSPLTLMTVHAHPDDEAISTGGLLARCADDGMRTVLVTCTGGEVGEIASDSVATVETLGQVRSEELRAACQILNVTSLHLLGYRDSGMAGTADNDHPDSFYRSSLDGAVAKLVGLIRLERPEVLVTYDDNGFYGHPDHIKANRITVAAFAAAADLNYQPAAGPVWQVSRLFYTAISFSRMREFGRRLRENGVDPPLDPDDGGEPSIGTPDHLVTTILDVTPQVERKRQALLAHASQMGSEVLFAKMPAQLFAEMFGTEEFQLIQGEPEVTGLATDLFAGLRQVRSPDAVGCRGVELGVLLVDEQAPDPWPLEPG